MSDVFPPVDWKAIRLIAFDAVGTLIYPTQSVAATYVEVAAIWGVVREQEYIANRFRGVFQQLHAPVDFDSPSLATNEARERETWRAIVAQVLEIDGEVASAVFEALWRYYSLSASWRLFSDARECLQKLIEAKVEFAITSNFDSRLRAICATDELLSKAKWIFPSSEIGWRKPSREYFRQVATAAGTRPNQILLVGDDPVADLEGARAAGWQALLLNRSSVVGNDELMSLSDLPQKIS